MIRDAFISPCGLYRYWLVRSWDTALPMLCFVMLNPSTADAERDDPTITRCIERAKRLGYGGMIVVNLFAYRSTDPLQLWNVPDPIGPDNDQTIIQTAGNPATTGVICGWGNHGAMMQRGATVLRLLRQAGVTPHALRMSKAGQPCHPLYLPYDLLPEPMK